MELPLPLPFIHYTAVTIHSFNSTAIKCSNLVSKITSIIDTVSIDDPLTTQYH